MQKSDLLLNPPPIPSECHVLFEWPPNGKSELKFWKSNKRNLLANMTSRPETKSTQTVMGLEKLTTDFILWHTINAIC